MARASPLGRRWGVRRTSVLIAVAVVFLALLGGGALLVLLLQSALASTTSESTTARAGEVADLAVADGMQAAMTAVRGDSRPSQLLQIVSASGQVLAASRPRIAAHPLSARLRPAPGISATVHTEINDIGRTDDFLVAAVGFTVGGQSYVAQVAAPMQVQAQTVQTVAVFLLGAAPLLLVVVGFAVWVLVGRALGPVEVIRGQVAQIDGQRLTERVAVPPTSDEIAALASTMNVMLDRLEASDRAQRTFVSDASHELRSPLSTVLTVAEVSAADPTGARWRERVETVLLESKRMRFLVDNLMTLAKADSHDLDLRRDDVDLDDVVQTEIQRLRSSTGHRVVVAVPPVRMVGDALRLTQVARNLLENADRHACSTISVSLSSDDTEAVFCIDNDGPVIEASLRERVFERFVRLDDSRSRDFGGSGLGLAISAEIVHAHGGSIFAEESPAHWCRFRVVLPRRLAPEQAVLSLDSVSMRQHDESFVE